MAGLGVAQLGKAGVAGGPGRLGTGTVRQGAAGMARRGQAWHGEGWQARSGVAWLDTARQAGPRSAQWGEV